MAKKQKKSFMLAATFEFHPHERMYIAQQTFTREFISRLKEKHYLRKVEVDWWPETFQCEMNFEEFSFLDDQTTLTLYIYPVFVAPKQLIEAGTTTWKNRDIIINEEDHCPEFNIVIDKKTLKIIDASHIAIELPL